MTELNFSNVLCRNCRDHVATTKAELCWTCYEEPHPFGMPMIFTDKHIAIFMEPSNAS